MTQDRRSRKIVIVAHCILNQNSRVQGKAFYAGMIGKIVDTLRKHEIGIIQMPCPELTYAGLARPRQTKKQYNTPAFRKHCRHIASSTVDQVEDYLRNGFRVIAIIGVEGSPTCGVNEVSSQEAGMGVFIEALQSEQKRREVEVPMKGVRDRQPDQVALWLKKTLTRI